MPGTELEYICRAWLAAWSGNRPEHLRAFYSDNAYYRDPTLPEGLRGAELLPYFRKHLARHSEWQWELLELLPTPKGCCVKWRATIPTPGSALVETGLDLLEFEEGKITRNEVFFDRAALLSGSVRKELENCRALLDVALDNAPFGFVFVDLDCRYIRVNRKLTKPTGRDPSMYPGKTVREMVPVVADRVEEIVRVVRDTGKPFLDYELAIGNFKQIFHSYPVRDAAGKMLGVCSFVTDVTEAKSLETAIAWERARLADFVEQLPGVVWESRALPGGGFEPCFVNDFAKKILGYAREEWFGAGDFLAEHVAESDREPLRLAREEVARTRESVRIELRCAAKDGTVVTLDARMLPLFGADGTISGVRGVMVDISDRKRAEADRVRLLEELRVALGRRDEFISVASHELRTPLSVLSMAAHMIQTLMADSRPDMESLRKLTGDLQRQTDRLSRLVSDMRYAAREGNQRLGLQLSTVDLGMVVKEVLATQQPQLARVECRFEPAAEVDFQIRSDRFRLEQVVQNLLSNALKYGEGKPIEVRLERAADGIVLSVRDGGRGIAPENQERIFRRFERVAGDAGVAGLGLGLYIVKRITESLGGKVSVESAIGAGACFRVELPFNGAV
jgi:PAS domain S-box-containing protein